MYELWMQGALNFSEILTLTYKKLGLDEKAYAFLVIFARMVKERPTGWTLSEVHDLMTLEVAECSQIFYQLITDGFLLVESEVDATGRRNESYSLAPLFLKIESQLKKEHHQKTAADVDMLFNKIENVFGVLSPRDIERIRMWLDEDRFDVVLIELALSEMQRHDVRSIKYIDAILLDWKRKNIYTVDEAKRSLIDFRNRKTMGRLNDQSETLATSINAADYRDWIGEIKQKLRN